MPLPAQIPLSVPVRSRGIPTFHAVMVPTYKIGQGTANCPADVSGSIPSIRFVAPTRREVFVAPPSSIDITVGVGSVVSDSTVD